MEFLIIILIIAAVYWLPCTTYISGSILTKRGKRLTYVIGDNLHFGSRPGRFHGIDIILPTTLPHIYLDAQRRQGFKGPRSFLQKSQKLQLEGDFNNYFKAYVVPGFDVLALSILTPDVLQTLIKEADGIDVEIEGNHLRLISNTRIGRYEDKKQLMIGEARRIVEEVEHKLQSWSAADARQAAQKNLKTENMPTLFVAGRNFRLSTILLGSIYGLLSLVLWSLTIDDIRHPRNLTPSDVRAEVIVTFLFFPVLYALLIIGVPRGWFNWIFNIAEKMNR
ncbi:MAG TPA: hypothetical protein VLG37_01000 [Candidatus Saccharimonadales bacterium]|nr:hypothetical protein [Candidatus Saccharimonadales bacterium]